MKKRIEVEKERERHPGVESRRETQRFYPNNYDETLRGIVQLVIQKQSHRHTCHVEKQRGSIQLVI